MNRTKKISLQIEHFRATLDRFDAPKERISNPIPVLFQSGYLTLKETVTELFDNKGSPCI